MAEAQRIVRRAEGPNGEHYVIENPSSVEISRNAKGEFSFCVKVYDSDPANAATRALAIVGDLGKQITAQCPKEPLK